MNMTADRRNNDGIYDWAADTDVAVLVPRLVAEFLLAHLERDWAPLHPKAHEDAIVVLRDALSKREPDWTPPHGIRRPSGG